MFAAKTISTTTNQKPEASNERAGVDTNHTRGIFVSLHMTREQAEAHQRKHGFLPTLEEFASATGSTLKPKARQDAELKRIARMTNAEVEYGLILEAQKRAREVVWYGFEAIRLKWGEDPQTGEAMWYKPDFFVIENADGYGERFKVIEVKGPWISERDLVRFKGCRAAWPSFFFEMHQRDKEGRWTRIQ
jgi:hypothetical protein